MALSSILYLKKRKSCYLHCTEYGWDWKADCIGYDGDYLYEIEVKTSYEDFQNDFYRKPKKHERMLAKFEDRTKPNNGSNYIANYMYYLVTNDIKDFALNYLEENNLPYGLLLYNPNSDFDAHFNIHFNIESIRKTKRLHDDRPTKGQLKMLLARMSNEYIYNFLSIKKIMTEEMDGVIAKAFQRCNEKSVENIEGSLDRIFKEDSSIQNI